MPECGWEARVVAGFRHAEHDLRLWSVPSDAGHAVEVGVVARQTRQAMSLHQHDQQGVVREQARVDD